MINAFRVLLNFCNGKKMNLHIDRYNKESSLNKINQCTQPCNDELKEISEITELMRLKSNKINVFIVLFNFCNAKKMNCT